MSQYPGRGPGRPPRPSNINIPDGPRRRIDYLATVTNANNRGVEATLQGFPGQTFWLNERNMRLDNDPPVNVLDLFVINQTFTTRAY